MISKITINKTVKNILIREIEKSKGLETGGVLCGNYNSDTIMVESASGPGQNAVRSFSEFIMDKIYMDSFLDEQYSKSIGKNIYVGEWHSHPEVFPFPSEQDIISIIERTYEWEYGEIIFLIFGFIN